MEEKQKELLSTIMNDKFARGAFAGMIFNQWESGGDFNLQTLDEIIERALTVRLRLEELSK